MGALFYDTPFAVDLHVFDIDEFETDRDAPGTLPKAIMKYGELLYEHPAHTPAAARAQVG